MFLILFWVNYKLWKFQVIKGITDGGADFCFECVGDSDMLTTALESCCDVILYTLKNQILIIKILCIILQFHYVSLFCNRDGVWL
jgi:hypothetical protein